MLFLDLDNLVLYESFLFIIEDGDLNIYEGWVIKFLLHRCHGISYFSLKVVDLDIGTLNSIVDK